MQGTVNDIGSDSSFEYVVLVCNMELVVLIFGTF